MDDLENRVQQFGMMQLPGQPMGMHMGTSYLVDDLWREVQKLRAELKTAEQSVQATVLSTQQDAVSQLNERFSQLKAADKIVSA